MYWINRRTIPPPTFYNRWYEETQRMFHTPQMYPCLNRELEALECMEYYGPKQGKKLCVDYYDDYVECVQQNLSVSLNTQLFYKGLYY